MIKLRSRRLFKSKSKLSCGGGGGGGCSRGDIGWELRPGGMLVQKRASGGEEDEEVIQLRITTGSWWHDISILATSTFGELKVVLSLVTGLEPREQRLLFRGKEREDGDRLHMVGVQDRDKVLLLEDPAIRERKLRSTAMAQAITSPCRTYVTV
ncbi:BAG family molecular chaperone regulator 1-like [Phoenix dactylifera]|uniref:BAG family molecular chaperone regulator 1-like n=1 Tax=Phoenix dactylifera TaxID=42345 RepID=A0A8B7CIZ7_PHODC|nr:BAG family molecular chaperone regulator 1-like [Phoenix dactylifera]